MELYSRISKLFESAPDLRDEFQKYLPASAAEKKEGDEGEGVNDEDSDKPRYCYCKDVGYGEMIQCDATNCSRHWFHLKCVGLDAVPAATRKFSSSPPFL